MVIINYTFTIYTLAQWLLDRLAQIQTTIRNCKVYMICRKPNLLIGGMSYLNLKVTAVKRNAQAIGYTDLKTPRGYKFLFF